MGNSIADSIQGKSGDTRLNQFVKQCPSYSDNFSFKEAAGLSISGGLSPFRKGNSGAA